jgi:hypothetical protein
MVAPPPVVQNGRKMLGRRAPPSARVSRGYWAGTFLRPTIRLLGICPVGLKSALGLFHDRNARTRGSFTSKRHAKSASFHSAVPVHSRQILPTSSPMVCRQGVQRVASQLLRNFVNR